MGILQHPRHFNIYGLRFLDKERSVIVQKIWEVEHPEEAQWFTLYVPDGREIIGMHGIHNGAQIRGLGLQVWYPNPATMM